jgi:hypothetical protein
MKEWFQGIISNFCLWNLIEETMPAKNIQFLIQQLVKYCFIFLNFTLKPKGSEK